MTISWERYKGEGDPEQRFHLYRLCPCEKCGGEGKITNSVGSFRCDNCRGEGRMRELVAACETEAAIGIAIVTLGREGEWEDCPFGLLDTQGAVGLKWLIRPWLPSARNVKDAARVLARSKKKPKLPLFDSGDPDLSEKASEMFGEKKGDT